MKVIAHRGYSAKFPENTLIAFKEALRLGAHGIELDVHLTKDHHVVVIHDEQIDRTTDGKGYVKDYTLQQLQTFDAGSWFNPLFAAEKIPTLAQVLALVKETDAIVNIELKTNVFPYEGLLEEVFKLVKLFNLEERTILSSFDHEVVVKALTQQSKIAVAPLFSDLIINPWAYTKELGASSMHVSGYMLLRQQVQENLKEGAIVRVYTINEIEHIRLVKQLGIDAMITDEVEKALSCL